MRRAYLAAAAAAGAVLLASPAAWAAETVRVAQNATQYIYVGETITRIAAGNPDIAIFHALNSSNDFLVEGHSPGTTTVLVWTAGGRMREYQIVVTPEDTGLALVIQQMIGLPGVQVKKVGNNIMLLGRVDNQYERNYAVQVARLYVGGGTGNGSGGSTSLTTGSGISVTMSTGGEAGSVGGARTASAGQVIDMLQMSHPSQIRLEAQVVEVSSSDARDLGAQYYGGSSADSIGQIAIYGTGSDKLLSNPFKLNDWTRQDINGVIRALVTQNKAHILSRPSITTMSGEEANIHIGGIINLPMSDDDGDTTYQEMEYGIILKIKPTVDANNMITSSVHAEVSRPDYTNAITYNGSVVPGKSMRTANSVVTMLPGNTMVIGGLMDSQDSRTLVKVPFFGDIPIIGQFFRYTSKSKDKRELLILVTPRLVDETTPAAMSDEAKALYEQGRQEDAAKQDVDLEAPPEPGEAEQRLLAEQHRLAAERRRLDEEKRQLAKEKQLAKERRAQEKEQARIDRERTKMSAKAQKAQAADSAGEGTDGMEGMDSAAHATAAAASKAGRASTAAASASHADSSAAPAAPAGIYEKYLSDDLLNEAER